jgi:hypothetical protein
VRAAAARIVIKVLLSCGLECVCCPCCTFVYAEGLGELNCLFGVCRRGEREQNSSNSYWATLLGSESVFTVLLVCCILSYA